VGLLTDSYGEVSYQANSTTGVKYSDDLVYTYDSLGLILPYAFFISAAGACAFFGVWANLHNQVSYVNNFSTFVRMTRSTKIDRAMGDGDDGSYPLPKRLGNLHISLPPAK
jgi:hypothetical protein